MNDNHRHHLLITFQHRLAGHVRDALGLVLVPHELPLDVPEPNEPPVHVCTGRIVSVEVLDGILAPIEPSCSTSS